MLKHRVILGLILTALFVGLITLDWFAARRLAHGQLEHAAGAAGSGGERRRDPDGAVGNARTSGAGKTSTSPSASRSLPRCCACSGPWIEQFGDSIQQRLQEASAVRGAGPPATAELERMKHIQSFPDVRQSGALFKSVKPHYLVPTIASRGRAGSRPSS